MNCMRRQNVECFIGYEHVVGAKLCISSWWLETS